jgi:type II secretory ATPase GspE/PulE/Tfp pilus assembly ATPase PilB-like protein
MKPSSDQSARPRPHRTIPPSQRRLGDLMVQEGLITSDQLQEALHIQETMKGAQPFGQILVDQHIITPRQLSLFLDRYSKRPRLGEVLVKSGVITPEQLTFALEQQKQTGLRLGETLLQLNYTKDEVLRQALCTQFNIPFFDLDTVTPDRSLTRLINKNYARKHLVIPIARIGTTLTLAMDDPTNLAVIEELQGFTGLTVNVVTSTHAKLQRAFSKVYEEEPQEEPAIGGRLELIREEPLEREKKSRDMEEDLQERADRITRKLIGLAMEYRASDIHLETLDNSIHTRFRIDGVLQTPELGVLDEAIYHNHRAIISRIKVLGNLDIAERRRPQDGSFRARLEKEGQCLSVDFRISIIPGYYGENVVLRLLDQRNAPPGIRQLGFSKGVTENLLQLLQRPTGMVLITGPTGSGKSTTLFAALMTLYRPGIKVLTVEDPIEYVYEHFVQCEVNERLGNTFATYLRSFLRHDPEVIMLGEIRDSEAAELAFRAAQTGHLVLSTMHTNDAVSSIMRLLDLNIDPGLITSSLLGVLAQRLVRENCRDCQKEYQPSNDILKEFFRTPPDLRWQRGTGCESCHGKGYKGRMPVGELWMPSDKDFLLINKRAPFDELRASSYQSTIFMAEDVSGRLREGRTNPEELIRMLPYSSVYQFRDVWPEQDGAVRTDGDQG